MLDTAWIHEKLQQLGQIGATESGGRTRLCYTEEDTAGRQFVRNLMTEIGLQVREDMVGNLFGRLEGEEPNLPPVLIGSHVDTVPNAGAFDGCMGVISALAVVKEIRESGQRLRYPIEVVSFMGEESSRFGLAMVGSRSFAGLLDPADLDRYRDSNGQTLTEVLAARGAHAEQIKATAVQPGSYRCFLEVHIDQSSYLDDEGVPIGVVTGIAAPERLMFTVHGEAAHSGAAAMATRRDALMCTAHALSHLEEITRREAEFKTVATVGQLNVKPNSINVVPGEVTFSLDVRSVYPESRSRIVKALKEVFEQETARRKMSFTVDVLKIDEPVPMNEGLRKLLTEACEATGVGHTDMPSGAGHDAMQVATLCPTAMLLCRNVSHTSHNPDERPADEDVAAAARVFAAAVRRLAEGEEF